MGIFAKIMLAAVINTPPYFSDNMIEVYFSSCNYQCDWSGGALPMIQGLRFLPAYSFTIL